MVTIVEVIIGGTIKKEPGMTWNLIILLFIVLTIVKAGYIVLVFMHLGDERKNFRYMILGPYILFILYLIFHLFTEATYWGEIIHQ